MNLIRNCVTAVVAFVRRLTAPKTVDDIIAELHEHVELLERARLRAIEQSDRVADQLDALRGELERLDAEEAKAWHTISNLRNVLED